MALNGKSFVSGNDYCWMMRALPRWVDENLGKRSMSFYFVVMGVEHLAHDSSVRPNCPVAFALFAGLKHGPIDANVLLSPL